MKILLFARARELVGVDHITLDASEPATVGDLRRCLSEQFPALSGLIDKSAIAVNDEFAEDNARIAPGAEVALLPPVSGG